MNQNDHFDIQMIKLTYFQHHFNKLQIILKIIIIQNHRYQMKIKKILLKKKFVIVEDVLIKGSKFYYCCCSFILKTFFKY